MPWSKLSAGRNKGRPLTYFQSATVRPAGVNTRRLQEGKKTRVTVKFAATFFFVIEAFKNLSMFKKKNFCAR